MPQLPQAVDSSCIVVTLLSSSSPPVSSSERFKAWALVEEVRGISFGLVPTKRIEKGNQINVIQTSKNGSVAYTFGSPRLFFEREDL
mmetsp:Transcript_27801/g.35976  ORF Transcript_27801/g.35976 Transcript_27801/m.35976 type:complete len:87 (+) Transcript_27801:221-481(+)